jgi:hypothetical protein
LFDQLPSHDGRKSALASLITFEAMRLRKANELTGVSQAALSRRNQLPKEQLIQLTFSKVVN